MELGRTNERVNERTKEGEEEQEEEEEDGRMIKREISVSPAIAITP